MTKARGAERDISVKDSRWRHECGHRHRPGSPCPRTRIWFVASMCMQCSPGPAGTRYCKFHDTKGH